MRVNHMRLYLFNNNVHRLEGWFIFKPLENISGVCFCPAPTNSPEGHNDWLKPCWQLFWDNSLLAWFFVFTVYNLSRWVAAMWNMFIGHLCSRTLLVQLTTTKLANIPLITSIPSAINYLQAIVSISDNFFRSLRKATHLYDLLLERKLPFNVLLHFHLLTNKH